MGSWDVMEKFCADLIPPSCISTLSLLASLGQQVSYPWKSSLDTKVTCALVLLWFLSLSFLFLMSELLSTSAYCSPVPHSALWSQPHHLLWPSGGTVEGLLFTGVLNTIGNLCKCPTSACRWELSWSVECLEGNGKEPTSGWSSSQSHQCFFWMSQQQALMPAQPMLSSSSWRSKSQFFRALLEFLCLLY